MPGRFFTLRPSIDDFTLFAIVDSISVPRIVDGIRLKDKELRPILAEAKASARRERGIMATLVLYVLPCIISVIALLAGWFITPHILPNLFWHAGMVVIIANGLMYLFFWLYRSVYMQFLQRHIRRAMQILGHYLCPECGYDLSGADHQACPECGEEIRKANPA